MIRIPCPKCIYISKSMVDYNRHLAIEHESYENGEQVSLATLRSLEKVKDRTYWLMLRFSNCRRPDNGDLFLKALQYWIQALVYDEITQSYALTDKDAPRNMIKHRTLRWALAQLETYRRCREELQEDDRKMYHKPGMENPNHKCILTSSIQEALTEAREDTIRRKYGMD